MPPEPVWQVMPVVAVCERMCRVDGWMRRYLRCVSGIGMLIWRSARCHVFEAVGGSRLFSQRGVQLAVCLPEYYTSRNSYVERVLGARLRDLDGAVAGIHGSLVDSEDLVAEYQCITLRRFQLPLVGRYGPLDLLNGQDGEALLA